MIHESPKLSVHVTCYAKINLFLKVYGKRPDGYHDIISVMQSIDLADTIKIELTSGKGLEIVCSNPDIPTDERNLAWKATWAIAAKAGRQVDGLKITIDKGIPVMGGLAGGSADCAGTLLGLRELWSVDMEEKELIEIGAGLGSDVPFCLVGGTAIVRGRGEIVEPLPSGLADNPLKSGSFLVVLPSMKIETKAAYDALDKRRILETRKWESLNREYAEIRDLWLRSISDKSFPLYMQNDFEPAVLSENPNLAALHTYFRNFAGHALLSGSGSAIFAYFHDQSDANEHLMRYAPIVDESLIIANPVARGVEFD